MADIKKIIAQIKVEGVVRDVFAKADWEDVITDNGVPLSELLADYITSGDVEARLAEIIGTAPAALDTLGEIATQLAENKDLHDVLVAGLTDKVNKEEGKGLSENDFTNELRLKLENLTNYIHPTTHSANMIIETTDKQFVTALEKIKITESSRILSGTELPADMTENDLFLKIIL